MGILTIRKTAVKHLDVQVGHPNGILLLIVIDRFSLQKLYIMVESTIQLLLIDKHLLYDSNLFNITLWLIKLTKAGNFLVDTGQILLATFIKRFSCKKLGYHFGDNIYRIDVPRVSKWNIYLNLFLSDINVGYRYPNNIVPSVHFRYIMSTFVWGVKILSWYQGTIVITSQND